MNEPTIGILYPGEMGAAVASVLRLRGYRVVTALEARSESTRARSTSSGIERLDSIAEFARVADMVFSIVPPAAAEETAEAWCALANTSPADAIYVDVNSTSPETAIDISRRVESADRSCVDASINGMAKNLTTTATLFVSGERCDEVARVFAGVVRTQSLGPKLGNASMMKMLLAGLSKGVCALYVELAAIAQNREMFDAMRDAAAQIYPGISALIERMLPTYALHANRRVTEMTELEATARASGIEPLVVSAIREVHEAIARANFDGETLTVAQMIEQISPHLEIQPIQSRSKEFSHGK